MDGQIYELPPKIELSRYKSHTVEVVVDRLQVRPGIRKRLTDSIETTLKTGKGVVGVCRINPGSENKDLCASEMIFSEYYACSDCGISIPEIEPRVFSFNSPYGACPGCNGLGTKLEFHPDLIVPDKNKSINAGALEPWKRGGHGYILYYRWLIREPSGVLGFDLDTPFNKLGKAIQKEILHGTSEEVAGKPFEGVIPHLARLFVSTKSDYLKSEISGYMSTQSCRACNGAR